MLTFGVVQGRQRGKRPFELDLQHHPLRTTTHSRHLSESLSFPPPEWPLLPFPKSCLPRPFWKKVRPRWTAPKVHRTSGAVGAFYPLPHARKMTRSHPARVG